jgi:RND family efflux transporter MFP subunit
VTTGQRVSAGQPLVELEQGAFRATAQSADAALTAARLAYERAQRLAGEGIVPRKDVEQAAASLAKARADAVAARREAQLAVLRSPIPGVVTSMTATLGAAADASQPLVEVTDPSALDAMLNVSPTDAARVRPGATVTLSAGQSTSGEPLGTGRVASVEAEIDTTTRGVLVRVLVPQARRTLRVGETVYGQIAVATRAAAITVPLEALVPEGDGFKVFVVDASGVAHARPVTVGARTEQAAEITSGLAAGERVVTYGAYGVEDSAKVVQVPR